MNQNKTEQLYKFYRNLQFNAPSVLSSFQKLDQSPDNPRSHFELGEAALQAGLLHLAVECFATVTELASHVEAGFFNLGNAYFELREFSKAKQAYEQAFVLNPDCGTLNNLGNTFAAMEDWQNAVQIFDRALSLPGSPAQIRSARSNKGKALIAATDWEGAIENYRQAILQFPRDYQFLALKAKCHHQKFEFGKAIECLVDALDASPSNPELLCEIANVNFSRGRTLEALLCMNQAFSILTPPTELHSRWLQMLTSCAPSSPERLFTEASDWATSVVRSNDKLGPLPTIANCKTSETSPNQPLRVGILCQSLASRGLNDWLPNSLGKCDPTKMQWFVFCDSAVTCDTETALARIGCRLEVTTKLTDSDLASLIANQQLDVLIDMIGHGLSTRLQVIARKPAPVQVSWFAFPMTSGLKKMGFIWSDQIAIPPEAEQFYSEQVVRFPQSFLCFQPSRTIELQVQSDSAMSPFHCGFLGKPEQISDSLIEAMQAILISVSDSELVFIGLAYRDAAFQSEIREKFGNIPEGASRVRFECFEWDEDELNSYQQLDVTLDAFYVSSPQRSFESLWMGVPVVTHLDTRLSGRSTASILHALNRKDWIANSPSEYVDAVKLLAESRAIWRAQRTLLRAELLASQMCDTTLIAKNIENAIDQTLRQNKLATNSQ